MSEQQKIRAAIDNEVIRAVAVLRQQKTVARDQDGQTVFVSGTEAAREYLIETLALALESGEPTSSATPQQSVGLVCPFCGDDDFDAIGLKLHLATYCEAYASLEVGNRVY